MLSDVITQLKHQNQQRFEELFKELSLPDEKEFFLFKIHLEGTKFHGTVSADLAHAIWKLQISYYRFVAFVLYGDTKATLTTDEKEQYLLNFQIEKGSTLAEVNIGEPFFRLLEKFFDKMDPWQIFVLCVLLIGSYVGKNYLTQKSEDNNKQKDRQLISDTIEGYKEMVKIAFNAGKEGRTAILKHVSNINKANIGVKEYSTADIEKVKLRRTKAKAISNTSIVQVSVDEIDTTNKDDLKVILREKETGDRYKASFDLNLDEDDDNSELMDLIWNSARYNDRYFWAEILFITRRDKLEKATILNIAEKEEDLNDTSDSEDF